jgi:hypothetical protein
VEVGEEPGYLYTGEGSGSGTGEKRKLGEYGGDEAEGEGFKFEHRDKRAVRDVYDEDWDPKQVLGKARVRVKEERLFGESRKKSRRRSGAWIERDGLEGWSLTRRRLQGKERRKRRREGMA